MVKSGGRLDDQNKHNKRDVFEYEDFGTSSLYLWTIIVAVISFIALIIFALLVSAGVYALSEIIL